VDDEVDGVTQHRVDTVNNQNILTLLSDTQAGSIYDVTDLQASGEGEREQVVTLLLHARFARELMNKSLNEMHDKSAEALEQLFPGARQRIRSSEIFVYPSAVAYWPLELGRSRFDALANVLRRPHGRILLGGDTTEDSHSEGAVVAALRMKRQVLGLLPSLILGCGRKVRLKSWKGDYLQRTEQPQGVTTLASGAGTDWLVECQCSEGKVLFKSAKGDYLSRPDTAQGVSSASSGPGTEWAFPTCHPPHPGFSWRTANPLTPSRGPSSVGGAASLDSSSSTALFRASHSFKADATWWSVWRFILLWCTAR
jgi:hypothetical protein